MTDGESKVALWSSEQEKNTQRLADQSMKEILSISKLSKNFGGIQALSDISLEARKGEILSIIGPNGAGKTTIFNCISGFYKPTRGEIFFLDQNITGLKPDKIAKAGIGRSFQNIALFKGMTVLDNIKLGAESHLKYGLFSSVLYHGKVSRAEVELRREIEERIIDLLEIEHIRHKFVGTLPYGLQKRVELARALAMRPKLLLLDEPTAGMNTEETEDIARYVIDIVDEFGIPIVLIEHDMGVVMDLSERVIVLDFGRIIATGSPREIQGNPEVIKAYLGAQR
jgi:branched-chain amino acid transport system ATP-binding protein